MPIEAAPMVVAPSGDFLGSDGNWSTFSINAGTPPQQLQVLANTAVASTWVVTPDGCSQSEASNCTETRGGTYDDTKSSSWNVNALFQLGIDANLGYSGNEINGTFGYENLEIQGDGANVSVNHQVIAGIATTAFYVGGLGLSNQPITFGKNQANTSPSLLTSLKNQNLVPSQSYGYTAGASYQQTNGIAGSLTLGGYDASRFTPNDVSFTFAPTVQRQLVVGVQAIEYSSGKAQTPLLTEGVLAAVDSTVPYLWLPQSVCTAFENAFGISWDPIHALYLVNDTLHETLLKENPSVVFQLANGISGGPSVNITLPYASFDLQVEYPLVKSPTKYFPLQRAADDSAITLGRTFLQEAFLIVDYEHSNFSVSQATHDSSAPSHIIPIESNSTTANTGGLSANPTSTNAPGGPMIKTTQHSSSHGIGTGAIAGIAIAIILIGSALGAFVFFRRRGKRNNIHKKRAELEANEPKDVPDTDDDDSKRALSPEPEPKKIAAPVVTEIEVPMTPPLSEADGNDFFTTNEKNLPQDRVIELPGSPGSRSELSSPDPYSRSELPSPDPELQAIRSELSTPDPTFFDSELPTPPAAQELESPGVSSVSSSQPSPPVDNVRHSSVRPLSHHMESSDSEAGFTFVPSRPFHRRYTSSDSVQSSRPRNSRMDSSDSDGAYFSSSTANRLDESSESEAIVSEAIASPVLSRPRLVQVDSSSSTSDRAVSIPSTTASQQIPRRPPPAQRMDSSSESEAPSPARASPPSRQIRGLARAFHSSSSSRPAIIRNSIGNSIHAAIRPLSRRSDSSDGEIQQTWFDSASTESPSDVSRFPSGRSRRGNEGTVEAASEVPIRQPRPVSGVAVEARNSILREEEVEGRE